jgi:hypothetical protein
MLSKIILGRLNVRPECDSMIQPMTRICPAKLGGCLRGRPLGGWKMLTTLLAVALACAGCATNPAQDSAASIASQREHVARMRSGQLSMSEWKQCRADVKTQGTAEAIREYPDLVEIFGATATAFGMNGRGLFDATKRACGDMPNDGQLSTGMANALRSACKRNRFDKLSMSTKDQFGYYSDNSSIVIKARILCNRIHAENRYSSSKPLFAESTLSAGKKTAITAAYEIVETLQGYLDKTEELEAETIVVSPMW